MNSLPKPQDVVAAGVDEALPERRDTGKAFMSDSGVGTRKRVFQMRHGQPEPDDRTRAIFFRGLSLEDWFLDEYEKKLGYKLERQHTVPSPNPSILGEGHVDGFCKELNTGLEIKTTSNLANQDVPYYGHLLQTAAYVNWGKMKEMRLIYLDPANFDTQEFPIQPNIEIKKQLVGDLLNLASYLAAETDPPLCPDESGDKVTTPHDRPCTMYYGRRKSLCPYHDRCWGDYSKPDAVSLNGHYADDIKTLARIKKNEGEVRSMTSELKNERDEVRDRLAPVVVEAGGEVEADGVLIKRTEKAGEKFNFKAADAAGMIDRDILGPYISQTKSVRWAVKEDK